MHVVEFQDHQSFARAVGILIFDVRGTFFVRSERSIVTGNTEFQALKDAGLVDANGKPIKENKRGGQKKKQ